MLTKMFKYIVLALSVTALIVIVFALVFTDERKRVVYKNNNPIVTPMNQGQADDSEKISNSDPGCQFIPTVPENGAYHGAFVDFGPTEDNVTKEKINRFQSLVQKKIAWAYFSQNWFDGIDFPKEQVDVLKEMRITPFIRLMPRSSLALHQKEEKFTLDNILRGDFDEDLALWAQNARQTNIPLFVEFGTEVNGDWFHWNGRWNGATEQSIHGDPSLADGPEKFRDAYRHIIDIFNKEQTHNVTWFYHINATSSPEQAWNAFMSYYPGDDYIDWIGISAYATQEKNKKPKKFQDIFGPVYKEITTQTKKPIALVEFGIAEKGRSSTKADWIQDAFHSIKEIYPLVKAVSYWQSSWTENGIPFDLRVDSSEQSLGAYKRGISDPYYLESISFDTCK